jgi:bacteriocin-like protein
MKELTFTELENVNGGMSCFAAKLGLIASGIIFVASAGAGLLITGLGLLALGWPLYDYIGACYPELMS